MVKRPRPKRAAAAPVAVPVRVDVRTGWAWCGETRLDLSPKAFAVLRHLVERPLDLVTKDDLFAAGWGETVVSEATLTSCIRDLRRALGDSSRTPRYIETVHRRGFRFVGPIVAADEAVAAIAAPTTPSISDPAPATPAVPNANPPAPALVGRDRELARLRALFAAAAAGTRRVVFVTGEAGIGKTTLVEAFLAEIASTGGARIARGQCLEHYGATEPYLPILEALGRLGRDTGRDELVRILTRYAPTWLAQLPALLGDAELEAVHRRTQGTTRERMLRELIEAIDALAATTPLVWLVEDLHWGDVETIDLLAMLGRRRDPARVLIVATHRTAEVAADGHPLRFAKQELLVHDACEELALDFLDEEAVGEYLARRFPTATFPAALAPVLHANTGGNPLFLVNVVDDLVAQGGVRDLGGRPTLVVAADEVASGVPETLRQMIEKQIDRLAPDEQAMLAVASVAGADFSAALAAADGIDALAGESICDQLARKSRFLRAAGVAAWPDGAVAGRYAFIHALYRNVLYDRIATGHRVGLHLRIGDRLERAHGARAAEIAAELAMHFEAGRDFTRAVRYRQLAGETALRQHGYRHAVEHATHALALLDALPPSPERARREMAIQTLLGAAVIATSGWAAPEVARAYARARELATETGVGPPLFPVLLGLCGFYLMRGEVAVADEISRQLLAVAETTSDGAALLGGHNTAGMVAFYRGDFTDALRHLERSKTIYDPELHAPHCGDLTTVDHDPGVSCAAHEALALFLLGHMHRAAVRMEECLAHACVLYHPPSVATGYDFAASFHHMRREPDVVQEIDDVRLDYAQRHDFDLFLMLGEIHRGWLLAEHGQPAEGAVRIQQGLAVYQAIGAELGRPTFLGIFADVCRELGRHDEARATIAEALALGARTGMHYWDAELHRLRGLIALDAGGVGARGDAEACFESALAVARRQSARFLELRAATCLARLWRSDGKIAAARELLSGVLTALEVDPAVADVREAQALLATLASDPATTGN